MAIGACSLSLILFFMKDNVSEELSLSADTKSTNTDKNDSVQSSNTTEAIEKFIEFRNKSGSVRPPVHRLRPWSQHLDHSILSLSTLSVGRLGEAYGAERGLVVVDRLSSV